MDNIGTILEKKFEIFIYSSLFKLFANLSMQKTKLELLFIILNKLLVNGLMVSVQLIVMANLNELALANYSAFIIC